MVYWSYLFYLSRFYNIEPKFVGQVDDGRGDVNGCVGRSWVRQSAFQQHKRQHSTDSSMSVRVLLVEVGNEMILGSIQTHPGDGWVPFWGESLQDSHNQHPPTRF